MQAQDTTPDGLEIELYVEPPGHRMVQSEIADVLVRALEQDRDTDHADATIDQLIASIQAGEPIDLRAPRSLGAAAHDDQEPTAAGYLLGLIRDRFLLGMVEDWREFVALGALAADIEAAGA